MCGFNPYAIGFKVEANPPLRYTVLNQYRSVQGSWTKEKDALKFIKDDIRANPTNKYYILEAVKEVATETPRLLIEEL